MRGIIPALVVLIIFALSLFFVMAARVIERDKKRRFKNLGQGIEENASALLAGFLHASPTDEPSRTRAGEGTRRSSSGVGPGTRVTVSLPRRPPR